MLEEKVIKKRLSYGYFFYKGLCSVAVCNYMEIADNKNNICTYVRPTSLYPDFLYPY